MSIDAVLMIAYGGPTRREDIRPFLENVVRGRRIPSVRLDDVVGHYELIGGRSPLHELTFRQADRLRAAVGRLPVYVGMRMWDPYVADTLAEMAVSGVREACGLIMSPFACEASRERYVAAVEAGRAALGARAPRVRYPGTWHAHPLFVEAVAARVREVAPSGEQTALVFTNHSIPESMAATAPYAAEFAAAAAAVCGRLGASSWHLAYQSRSGRPQDPWLEPDVNDRLRELAAAGARDVTLVPIGFVCDHVEVLYDLDVEAQRTAATLGLRLRRAPTVGDHPRFIELLAELTREARE
jgi:ferrochelatase